MLCFASEAKKVPTIGYVSITFAAPRKMPASTSGHLAKPPQLLTPLHRFACSEAMLGSNYDLAGPYGNCTWLQNDLDLLILP